MAHRDGRRFDCQPSLSRHCGHGPIFIGQQSAANDPYRTQRPFGFRARGGGGRPPGLPANDSATSRTQTKEALDHWAQGPVLQCDDPDGRLHGGQEHSEVRAVGDQTGPKDYGTRRYPWVGVADACGLENYLDERTGPCGGP